MSQKEIDDRFPGIKLRTDSFQKRIESQLDKGREKIWDNPEHIEKMRQVSKNNMIALNSDPNIRAKAETKSLEARMNHAKADPEWWRKIRSESAMKCGQNPSRKEAHSKLLKNLWTKEDYRKAQSERFSLILKDIWSDPEKAKKSFTGYRTRKKYLYVTENNSKIYFRSSWELFLAGFLDKNNIKWEYESLSIPYLYNNEYHDYIPDFVLCDKKIILEVKPACFVNDKVLIKIESCKEAGYTAKIVSENELFTSEDILLAHILGSSTTIESIT